MSAAESEKPLIIDLDGTLSNGDISYELCIKHLKEKKFIGFFDLLRGIYKGKAFLRSFSLICICKTLILNFCPITKTFLKNQILRIGK